MRDDNEKNDVLLHKWAFGLIDMELQKFSDALDDPRGVGKATVLDFFAKGINRNYGQVHDVIEFIINYADNYRTEFIRRAEIVSKMFLDPPSGIEKDISSWRENFLENWRKASYDVVEEAQPHNISPNTP